MLQFLVAYSAYTTISRCLFCLYYNFFGQISSPIFLPDLFEDVPPEAAQLLLCLQGGGQHVLKDQDLMLYAASL